jgi:molybdate transport system regulatory protein
MDISYRSALNYIERMEKGLGIKVVITRKGGRGGGGSTKLSPEGKRILQECKMVNAIIDLHKGVNEIPSIVKSIDEDKKVMKIEINNAEITLPRNEEYHIGDRILALISYENIFIMLEPYKSSVRNIIKGTITEMKLIGDMYRIQVKLGDVEIYSDITKSASDDLELALGEEVYVGFKAMSVATLKL